jgi:hypothetical protein
MSEPLLFERVLQTTESTGTGALSGFVAVPGFQTLDDVLGEGDKFRYYLEAVDSIGHPSGDWESGIGTWDDTAKSSTRSVINSSTGSILNLAAGTKRIGISPHAEQFGRSDKAQVRVTLSTGNPVYRPSNPMTPASRTGDDVNFSSAHGWETGTAVRVLATYGGLNKGVHFVKVVDSDTISLYDTAANAIAGGATGKRILTDTPKTIYPIGKANTALHVTPCEGGVLSLYEGGRWKDHVLTGDISIASLTLAAGSLYDVWVRSNAGTPEASLSAAWTNPTTRANAVAIVDGRVVKSGAPEYRWVATIYASATNTVEMSARTAGIFNAFNRLPWPMDVFEFEDNWQLAVPDPLVYRPLFNGAGAGGATKLTIVNGQVRGAISIRGAHASVCDVGLYSCMGIGVNSPTVNSAAPMANVGGVAAVSPMVACLSEVPRLGLSEYTALEYLIGAGTATFFSLYLDEAGNLVRRSGLDAMWEC